MNDLRDWLKDGDPVASEPPLSTADVQRMRRAIVAGSESSLASLGEWARGSWATAAVVIGLTMAVGMSRWSTSSPVVTTRTDATASAVAAPAAEARRQLQVIAPGGTRVIWIFNDDFKP